MINNDSISEKQCPICNGVNVYTSAVTTESIGQQRHICICENCTHLWRCPPPAEEELEKYYAAMKEQDSSDYDQHNFRRLDLLQKSIAGSHIKNARRIIEFGPGKRGVLPIAVNAREYVGIELSEYNRRELMKYNSQSLAVSLYSSIVDITEKSPCVVSLSALEHVISPDSVVKEIRSKICDDGVCILGVPDRHLEIKNPEQIFSEKLKELNVQWSDTDHLHSFSQKSMVTLLKKNGFSVTNNMTIGLTKYSKLYLRQNDRIAELLRTGIFSIKNILRILGAGLYLKVLAALGMHKNADYLSIYTCKTSNDNQE